MPIKQEREYRIAAPFSAVEGDEDSFIVEGYATTFDIPYEMEMSDIKEVILKSAFDECDMSDVIFQFDHQGSPMARIRNHTLELTVDNHGLHVRADLSGSRQGRELYEAIKNGLIDRMSWGFTVPDDGWDYDWETDTRTFTKIMKVYDVSAVSIPANQGTDIHARSAFDGVIEEQRTERSMRAESERRERERLALLLEL